MGLLFPGSTAFEQSEPEKWSPNGWDLDRLVVPYRGKVDSLSAFLAAATIWQASGLDANMYLESFPNDGDKQFPTVELNYIGKKGGTLPPAKNTTDVATQQARYTSFTGKTTVEITYNAPTSSKRVFGRSTIDIGFIGAITPANASVVWWLAHTEEGSALPVNEAQALLFFVQREITTGNCDELVPGQYFVATQTKINSLFSIAA